MPASIAKNAQEGTRSEYLAQYALSSFGTSIPVPHPEDSGIDLYCTLGRRVGRRFLVEHYYLVQVKSNNDPIRYEGSDEVKWLLSHNYPVFICIVTKKNAKLEIYQTVALSTLVAKASLKNITLHPCTLKNTEYFPNDMIGDNLDLYLGEPIIRFSASNFSDRSFNDKLCSTLKSWIELDQENINMKGTGCTLYRIPETWKTNEVVKALKFIGNFKDNVTHVESGTKFNDLFFKFLSQLVNQAASDQNIDKYLSLIDFINKYIAQNQVMDSFGIRIMQFCVNEGNKHLGLNERLNLIQAPNNNKNA